MYDNSTAPLASPACLNRFAFLILGALTLFWILYLVFAPPDPALQPFAPVLVRLVNLGLGLAWVFSLAASGLFWIIAQFTGRGT
jgi:hypothetical protein